MNEILIIGSAFLLLVVYLFFAGFLLYTTAEKNNKLAEQFEKELDKEPEMESLKYARY